MTDCYDRDGRPISFETWIELDKEENKRVAFDQIEPDVWVSTVWLGLNHQFDPVGPPIIFETMVFGGEHDQDQERYSTEEDALEGHRRWVELVSR
jgi:hypothetical protein